MAEERDNQEPLEEEELEKANGEPLPDREVMSTIDPSGAVTGGWGPPDPAQPFDPRT